MKLSIPLVYDHRLLRQVIVDSGKDSGKLKKPVIVDSGKNEERFKIT